MQLPLVQGAVRVICFLCVTHGCRRWIWHALEVVKPRLVIVEIQELWLWTVMMS